jgi:hypothetical protein
MSEFVREKIDDLRTELRAEFTTEKHDSKTLDLPALPVFRRRSDAA